MDTFAKLFILLSGSQLVAMVAALVKVGRIGAIVARHIARVEMMMDLMWNDYKQRKGIDEG